MRTCAFVRGMGAPTPWTRGTVHSSQLNQFLLNLSQLIHKMGSGVHTVKWLPCGFYSWAYGASAGGYGVVCDVTLSNSGGGEVAECISDWVQTQTSVCTHTQASLQSATLQYFTTPVVFLVQRNKADPFPGNYYHDCMTVHVPSLFILTPSPNQKDSCMDGELME